jgi:hypothetical protein
MKKLNNFDYHLVITGLEIVKEQELKSLKELEEEGKRPFYTPQYIETYIDDLVGFFRSKIKVKKDGRKAP